MKHDSDRLHTKSCKDIEPHLSCTAGSAKTWQFPVLDFQYSGGCQLGIKAAEDTLNSYELLQECRISGQMFMKGFFKPYYNLILNRPTLERSIQKDVLLGCGFKNKPRNGRTCNCAGELRLFDMAKSQYHLL